VRELSFVSVTTDLLGPYPYGKRFAVGHECSAEVVLCGERVRHFRKGQLVVATVTRKLIVRRKHYRGHNPQPF
jgi:threonine dehydrogenase-like Zn-dependent dehydrogenase